MQNLPTKNRPLHMVLAVSLLAISACAVVTLPYKAAKGTVKGGTYVLKTTYKVTAGTAKVVYRIGEFSYEVVKAPLSWPLQHGEIETIDGLSPQEAIRQGRVKNSPYTVRGKAYHPMSVGAAESYSEVGVASWYGYETRNKKGGHMTANGEVFDPMGLTAAHKFLPLPVYAKVTNLENDRSIIVRVNDRGPFPSDDNPDSGKRIIDLSLGAARKLGFEKNGTAKVRVEAVRVREG